MARRDRERVLWQSHPSWRGLISFYAKATGLGILASAAAIGLNKAGVIAIHWPILTVLIAAAAVYLIGRILRKTTIYSITTRRVTERSGVFNKKEESARLEDIQNIVVDRPLWQRMLGIGTLNFDTAGEHTLEGRDILSWWGIRNPQSVRDIAYRALDKDFAVEMDEEEDDSFESDGDMLDWERELSSGR